MNKNKTYRLLLAVFILSSPVAITYAETTAVPVSQWLNAFDHFEITSEAQAEHAAAAEPPFEQWPRTEIAQLLGWIPSTDNICLGYYAEPDIVLNYPLPQPIAAQQTTITADMPSLFSQKGTSILQGNVTVTQPGRQLTANQAYLHRDPQTGKISEIDMYGNVHMREAGKLIVAQTAHVYLEKKFSTMENAIYRFSKSTTKGALNAWGIIRHGEREPTGVLNLIHASYSTCPPLTNTWHLIASHLRLDKESGVGTATNSYLDIKNVPVAYLPYFSFPLDNRRKSGFLFPTFGYSSLGGNSLGIPYYFNLAPNYDATLTPTVYQKRGLQIETLFRYLTAINSGTFDISILPHDNAFQHFKDTAPAAYAGVPFENVYLDRLDRFSDTRGLIAFNDNSVFNQNWSNNLNLNYVSDDYYFQDISNTPVGPVTNQLLNQEQLNYQNEHWHFTGLLQAYQTLHPINDSVIQNQYSRTPEFDLDGDYPDEAFGLDYQLNNQIVYFDHTRDFITGDPYVVGTRYDVDPSVSLPLANQSGYFTPQIQLDTTGYSLQDTTGLQNQATAFLPPTPVPGQPSSITRVIPLFDIDSGLFFDRDFDLGQTQYRQTLEPRVFYLYVPVENQNDIPLFDTILPSTFNFGQMFQTNRFTSIDRVGDANQVTLALTTRILDELTGEEKISASIGEIYLFHQHQVCDTPGCSDDPTINENLSPLVGQLTYNLNPHWSLLSDLAWDPNRTRTNNGDLNFTYNNNGYIFTTGYYFVRNADAIDFVDPSDQENNLNRINLGAGVPITQHWSVVGDWNYNISHSLPIVYFYGAEYNSCCWAVRFLMSRALVAESQPGMYQYNQAYFVQLQLKGLGNVGNNDPNNLIRGLIPGYQDSFT